MTVMDYAALPPEVNSARMYAGAGAGPLLAAAAAWDQLATELGSAASSYQAAVAELTDTSWQGPAAASMAAAATPYITWMTTTATHAKQTGTQVRAAAAAYQAAHAATVPPQAITANRALLTKLSATNTFGQNTAAIAANQAQYGEMWAQDAAAMQGYAVSSSAAATVTPFSEPPQTTNPAGTGNQAAAANQAAATGADPSQWLLDFLTSPLIQDFNAIAGGTAGIQAGLYGGPGFFACGPMFMAAPFETALLSYLMAAMTPVALASDVTGGAEGALATLAGSSGSAVVSATPGVAGASASLARAASVGGLSVPQSWGSAAPAIRLASGATALPMGGLGALPAAASGGMVGGPIGPIGSVVNAPRNGERSRYGARAKLLPAMAGASGRNDTAGRWANFDGLTPEPGPASEREQLHGLRKAVAAMARERDVLKRSATLLIKEATHK